MICIRIILIWISFYEVQTLDVGMCFRKEIVNGKTITKTFCCSNFYWDNGGCREGCQLGHYGRNCIHVCEYPDYGKECKYRCNCSQDSCHYVSGCTETGQTTSKVQTTTIQQEVTDVFKYTTIKTQIAQSTHKSIENHQADGQNALFWISIDVIGSLLVIILTVCSFNLGLLQGIEYNGSTTVCDSVQNEVEPRGMQDGTMVVDNLRRHDNRPPSLRSVSS